MSEFQNTEGEQGFDRLTVQRHVNNLLRAHSKWDRDAYLSSVQAKEGRPIARHVADEFARARGLLQEGAR